MLKKQKRPQSKDLQFIMSGFYIWMLRERERLCYNKVYYIEVSLFPVEGIVCCWYNHCSYQVLGSGHGGLAGTTPGKGDLG